MDCRSNRCLLSATICYGEEIIEVRYREGNADDILERFRIVAIAVVVEVSSHNLVQCRDKADQLES
jgi:hypothetical protein